jgi:hypothetical protein
VRDEQDLWVFRKRLRVLILAGILALLGLMTLGLQILVESESVIAMHVLLTITGLFILYVALSAAFQSKDAVLILKRDGMQYFPIRWLFRRRPEPRFVRWEDIDRIRYIVIRGSRALDVYTQDRPAPKDSGYVNPFRLKPAARIPVLMLEIPERDLLREIRGRAWKQGVVLPR